VVLIPRVRQVREGAGIAGGHVTFSDSYLRVLARGLITEPRIFDGAPKVFGAFVGRVDYYLS